MFEKKLPNNASVTLLFALCWALYFSTYLGRYNYSTAMADMIKQGVLDLSQAGLIQTAYFACYAVGQLINGFLGDRVSPRLMIFIGVSAAALANLAMGITNSGTAMIVIWSVNGFAMSMVWAPLLRVFADMFDTRPMVHNSVHISTSFPAGMLAGYLLSALMLDWLGWRGAFFAPALILAVAAVLWWFLYGRILGYREAYGIAEPPPVDAEPEPDHPPTPIWKVLLGPAVLVMLVPVILQGMLKDGISTWVPTYIGATFNTSAATSALVTTLLPIFNLSGSYAVRFLTKHVFKNEVATSGFFFTLAAVALLLLYGFGGVSIWLTILLLAFITASMTAVGTALVVMVPLYYRRIGRVATMSGYLNAIGYLGAAISTASIGALVQHAGWSATILSWVLLAGVGIFICIIGNRRAFRDIGVR